MAQDTLSVGNGTGVAVRQAFNSAMQASATNQSGSSAPSTTYPFQFFADTNTNTLKIRNAANNAYINVSGVGQIGAANLGLLSASGGTISGNLIVSGNLTVSGTTTTVSSTTITVADKNIEIGKVASPSDTTADGGGLTLLGATNKTWNWVDSTDSWTSSEHIDLASGKVLKVAGTQILSATNFTGTSAIATNVTVADESSDTSCNVLFTTAATGNLPPKTGTNLTFNSSSGALTATSFNGDFIGQLGGDLQSNGNDIDFADNDKAIFGTGGDLEIFHDGSDSRIIDTGTGELRLDSNSLRIRNAAGTETSAVFVQDGACELRYDNVKKFETTSDGATVSGDLTIDGSTPELRMKVTDDSQSHRINFYNTADSIVSRIFAEPSGNISIRNGTNAAEECLKCLQNGAVELYYDNSVRLATTTDGVDFSGTGSIKLPVGTTAQRPASPATGDFRFNSTTSEAEIYNGSAFTAVGGGGATGGGGEKIFHESENEMNSSYTISTNHNALVAGPLTIASGATLTINSPSVVTIP